MGFSFFVLFFCAIVQVITLATLTDSGLQMITPTTTTTTAGVKQLHVMCVDPLNPDGWFIANGSTLMYCNGHSISEVASSGYSSSWSVDGMCCSRDRKRIYLSSSQSHRILLVDLTSAPAPDQLAGMAVVTTELDGTLSVPAITYPRSLVFDRTSSPSPSRAATAAAGVEPPAADSVLWIAANYLRRFDLTTRSLTTYRLRFKLSTHASMSFLSDGVMIIVNSNAVYAFDPRTGIKCAADSVVLVAGRVNSWDFADGVGLEALFSWPRGVAVVESRSGDRSAYISDTTNHRIRRLTLPPSLF